MFVATCLQQAAPTITLNRMLLNEVCRVQQLYGKVWFLHVYNLFTDVV